MKFSGTIQINKPRAEVLKYFLDPQYLSEYQDGFLQKTLVSGEPAANNTISKMYYKQGRGEMELTETITDNNLPDYLQGFYHHAHMDNTLRTTFKEINPNKTAFTWEGEYVAVRGFVPKMMMKLFPGMFRKPAERWMNNFKKFVEEQ